MRHLPNFGIVVSSGVWLMPKPEKFVFFSFEYVAKKEQFPSFINAFRELIFQNGILSRPHLANDFAMLCIVDRYPRYLLGKSEKVLSESAMSQWKQQHGIPDWTFGGGLYGTKQQIKAQKNLVARHLKPYGKVRFIGDTSSESIYGKFYRKLVMLGAKYEGKSDKFISQIFPAIGLFKGKPTDEFAKQVYFKSTKEKLKLLGLIEFQTRNGLPCNYRILLNYPLKPTTQIAVNQLGIKNFVDADRLHLEENIVGFEENIALPIITEDPQQDGNLSYPSSQRQLQNLDVPPTTD